MLTRAIGSLTVRNARRMIRNVLDGAFNTTLESVLRNGFDGACWQRPDALPL